MSLDPKSVPHRNIGSLQSCLVESDPEQRAREGRVRRKALITSVFAQGSLLAALILVPLFGRPAHLSWQSRRRFRCTGTSLKVRQMLQASG